MKSLKILTIAPTPFFADRGTHIRILEEARAQVRAGHRVTVATYHIGKDLPADISRGIDVRRIRRLLFWYKKLEAGPDWQKIILDLMLIRKVFFLARTEKPDVIHAHLHEGVLIGWIVQKLLFWRRMILIADMHGSLVNEMASHGYLSWSFLKKIFGFLERKINSLGDRAVVSSWENKDSVAKFRRDEVKVMLDGVDLSYYGNFPSKEELRAHFGLPSNKVILTYTGALIPNKGIAYFLEIIPQIVRKFENLHIVLAGFPVEHVQKFVDENNLSERVTIISPLSYFDLPKLLAASDIGIDPKDSAVGQASGKILQYMGAGLPVVCFDKENNREYLGEYGIYASSVSGESLAEAVSRAVVDENLRNRAGRGTRKKAEKFSWDNGIKVFEELVKSVEAGRQRTDKTA